MSRLEARERTGFQVEDITVVSGSEGSYVLFSNGPVVPNLSSDQQPGVTFGGLLNGEVAKHNNSHDLGVNEVTVSQIPGSSVENSRREVWSAYRPIRWNPETHTVVFVGGNKKAVEKVIEGAKRTATEKQVTARRPLRPAA